MNKIKCPNCGEVFEIDESKYSEIVAQVRNEQFEKEVTAQKDAFRREQEALRKNALAEALSPSDHHRLVRRVAQFHHDMAFILCEGVTRIDEHQKHRITFVQNIFQR